MNARRSEPTPDPPATLDELLLVERHHAEAIRAEAVVPGVEVHVDEDVTWMVHPGSAWRNVGILLRLSPASANRRLNTLFKRYERHGRGMGLWVSPRATPPNLSRLLADLGVRCKKQFPAMVRSLHDTIAEGRAEPSIRIQRVLDPAPFETTPHPAIGPITTPIRRHELDRLGVLVSSAAQRTRAYVAWIDTTPAGAIELFLGTEAAGVHGLHVLPAWQGRGVASALLEHVCREATHAGCSTLVLLASHEGERLYTRRAFREVGRIGFWYRSFQRGRR
jgi:GNAT superfamily N-acetyltransferase